MRGLMGIGTSEFGITRSRRWGNQCEGARRSWGSARRAPALTNTVLRGPRQPRLLGEGSGRELARRYRASSLDRKSTRLNSSHLVISYAVFCLKKKKKKALKSASHDHVTG